MLIFVCLLVSRLYVLKQVKDKMRTSKSRQKSTEKSEKAIEPDLSGFGKDFSWEMFSINQKIKEEVMSC